MLYKTLKSKTIYTFSFTRILAFSICFNYKTFAHNFFHVLEIHSNTQTQHFSLPIPIPYAYLFIYLQFCFAKRIIIISFLAKKFLLFFFASHIPLSSSSQISCRFGIYSVPIDAYHKQTLSYFPKNFVSISEEL